jgi:phage terminase large subunit-like protein
MTLSLVPPPAKPVVRPPAGPWFRWFENETAPLRTPSIATSAKFRRDWTRESPLRFALVYFPHHLVLQGSTPPVMTFNELHLGLCRAAKQWQQPKRWREAWIAPRGIGKTSWAFLILPLWALAHGHRHYFMAFSDTSVMAQGQLANLRMELDDNKLLRQDYPELTPRRGRGGSNTKATVVANGGTIAASGLGENTLGRKSGADRPDLLVFDDIEPLEDTMSEVEKRSRIATITRAALPMGSDNSAAIILGTTTSYGSVIHDLAQHARSRERMEWVENAGITARVFPGVQVDPDTGAERSIWPERWPLTETHFGKELRLTHDGQTPREFQLNYLLDPSPFGTEAGSFWRPELFQRRTSASFGGVWEHAMYIDPSMSDKSGADGTAIVVVGRDPARRHAVIEYAQAFRITAETLRQRIHRMLERKPTLRTIIVERNQGGERWREMLSPRHDPLPRHVRLETDWSSDSKRDRCEQALQWYETGRVFHAIEHTELEREMVMFPSPKVNDDLVDAATGALRWALDGKQPGAGR